MFGSKNNKFNIHPLVVSVATALGFAGPGPSYAAGGASPLLADLTPVFGAETSVMDDSSTCVIMSNGGDNQARNFRVTATENGSGAFVVTNGANSVPVHLWWRDATHAALELADGVQDSTIRAGKTTSGCGSSGPDSFLEVRFLRSEYIATYAPAGVYTADIDVRYDITSGSTNFTDTVQIALDIKPLTRISGLQNVLLNYTNPGTTYTNIQSLCVYTNDTANEVFIIPASTTYNNGNVTTFGLQGDRATTRYNLRFRKTGTSWNALGGNPDNGAVVGPIDTAGANIDCSNNGENVEMRLRIASGQADSAGAGDHTATLNLTVTVP